MRKVLLGATGEALPALGQGTWLMGHHRRERTREIEALQLGIQHGLTLIDTAEFYAGGEAERIVGDAVADCRQKVFIVTKVWPSHLGRTGRGSMLAAVSASLKRLRVTQVDAVLLHWPTRSLPLKRVLDDLFYLQSLGLTRHVGVSNFTMRWLEPAYHALTPGQHLAFNQMPYHPGQRYVEQALLPYCAERGTAVMAYSPLGHGRTMVWKDNAVVLDMARRLSATPAQVVLAWLLSHEGVVAIPKAVRPQHIIENAGALALTLSAADRAQLDLAFPAPTRRAATLPPYRWAHRAIWWAGARGARVQI